MKAPILCFLAALVVGFAAFSIAGERYQFAAGPSSISMRDRWTGKLYYMSAGFTVTPGLSSAPSWREVSQ